MIIAPNKKKPLQKKQKKVIPVYMLHAPTLPPGGVGRGEENAECYARKLTEKEIRKGYHIIFNYSGHASRRSLVFHPSPLHDVVQAQYMLAQAEMPRAASSSIAERFDILL